MSDRIKLAEAMGWERATSRDSHGSEWSVWQKPGTEEFYSVADIAQFPDPFTDANDDYAVLEWVNTWIFSKRTRFAEELGDMLKATDEDKYTIAWPYGAIRYKVGFYARAALKVIE